MIRATVRQDYPQHHYNQFYQTNNTVYTRNSIMKLKFVSANEFLVFVHVNKLQSTVLKEECIINCLINNTVLQLQDLPLGGSLGKVEQSDCLI